MEAQMKNESKLTLYIRKSPKNTLCVRELKGYGLRVTNMERGV